MTASYNAPDRPEDLEASFHSLGEAEAYAEEYGGNVSHRGVVFVVDGSADHDRAKDDLRALQAVQPNPATVQPSDIDRAVDRAVQASEDRLRAEFEAERAAWLAEHSTRDTEPPATPEA